MSAYTDMENEYEEKVAEHEARIESLEWAIRQALQAPMIGEFAKSILNGVMKKKD